MASVFKYMDYRKFLKDSFDELKAGNPAFSHRFFARVAGFSSSNFILLVQQGKRNLSGEAVVKVAKALKLKRKETEFFENLVRFNQAKTDDERNFYYGRIAASKEYAQSRPLEREQYKYYSKWYIPVVRELVAVEGFREDHAWIASMISPAITASEAKGAVDLLLEIGLIERDETGKLVHKEKHISGGDEVQSLAMANFQREMIELAAKSIEGSPAEKREIASVTFPISKERLVEAKKMIRDFRSRLAGFLAEEGKADAVYQFNVQLFGLSDTERGSR